MSPRRTIEAVNSVDEDAARAVHRTFLIALGALLIPSRFVVLAHDPNLARFAGATLSTALVWWGLYRLCLRSTRPVWMTATAVPALYVATFLAPVYAWATLLALAVVHVFLARYFPPSGPQETRDPPTEAGDGPAPDGSSTAPAPWSFTAVDLDRTCAPYRRLLLTLRIIRAGVASVANSAILSAPLIVGFALVDGLAIPVALVAGLLLAAFLGVMAALGVAWMRALWRGSRRAARLTVTTTAALALLMAAAAAATVDRELITTGTYVFHGLAVTLQLALMGSVAIGSATLLTRQDDTGLATLLRQNATASWRESVQQLAGVVLPESRTLRAFMHRSVALSVLALMIEGAAFYVYFKLPERMLEAADRLRAGALLPLPGPVSPLEGLYISLATIAALMLPIAYVSTQVVLAVAEGVRRAARRAAVRTADEVLEEDRRPPVIFLRDFDDDQVALDRAALPAWVRMIDPGVTLANLEDVMAACARPGPVVAIGRPGDQRPPVGAARRYVTDDWRAAVTTLIDSAAAIVVGVSDSDGLVWEIDQLRERGHLDKCVFVLPPMRRGNRVLTRQLIARLLAPGDSRGPDTLGATVDTSVGSHRVVGVSVRDRSVTFYLTHRPPSQVEFDVTLRLAMPSMRPERPRALPAVKAASTIMAGHA